MSLLLDALKKAELAKQIARADSPARDQPAAAEPAPEASGTRVITREKLPDITQPLEILTDDLPSSGQTNSAGPSGVRHELSLEDPQPAPEPQPELAGSGPGISSSRAQAEQLFQVKEMDYNPRRPFYLTLCALGVVAVGYGGYVWWQTRPKYGFPSPAPVASASAVAASTPAPAQVAQAPVAPAPAQAATASPARVIPPIQPVRPRPPRQAVVRHSAPASVQAESAAPAAGGASADNAPIAVNARIVSIDPLVQQGYRAFEKGDLAAARESYQKALAREPNNRDALLGMASIDVRSGQLEAAEARYLKVLEADPRDSQAVAGLIGLRGGLDPVSSESRLKTLITTEPDVAPLHFALGNQYARQSRWPEAQSAYFRAYSLEPDNPDFAFNLAVSLDQLRQKKPALEYYQRSLTLAAKRPASFDPSQARTRVQELSK